MPRQDPDSSPSAAFEQQMQALTRAYEMLVEMIENEPDRERAFTWAHKLTKELYQDASNATKIRAATAVENFENGINLTKLANSVGVSKQRANQIVIAGRRNTPDQ